MVPTQNIPGYKLIGPLGYSPHVSRALELSTDKMVVLKSFPATSNGSRQFQKELSTLASFDHPNIIAVKDIIYHLRDRHFLVFDFAEGGSLRDQLSLRRTFRFEEALEVLRQVSAGLHVAHKGGIVHRDLKPENILCMTPGEGQTPLYKIADLGIARNVGDFSMEHTGTPIYMAPEQFYDQASAASDLYALGVILYELLTGRPPFLGNHQELCIAHTQQIPDLAQISDERARVLLGQLLAKEPGARLREAQELFCRCSELLERSQDSGPGLTASGRAGRRSLQGEWVMKTPRARGLAAPFPGQNDTVWLLDHKGTDVVEGRRYHPRKYPQTIRLVSPARDSQEPCYFATEEDVYRLAPEDRTPIRLFRHRRNLQALYHDSGRLYLVGRRGVEACDFSGRRLWDASCVNHGLPPASGVLSPDEFLLTSGGAKNEVRSYHTESGSMNWSCELPGIPICLGNLDQDKGFELFFIDLRREGTRVTSWRLRQGQLVSEQETPTNVRGIAPHRFGSSALGEGYVLLTRWSDRAQVKVPLTGRLDGLLWCHSADSVLLLEQTSQSSTLRHLRPFQEIKGGRDEV